MALWHRILPLWRSAGGLCSKYVNKDVMCLQSDVGDACVNSPGANFVESSGSRYMLGLGNSCVRRTAYDRTPTCRGMTPATCRRLLLRLDTCFTNAETGRRWLEMPHRTTYWKWHTQTISTDGKRPSGVGTWVVDARNDLFISMQHFAWAENGVLDHLVTVYEFSHLNPASECSARLSDLNNKEFVFLRQVS